MLLCYVAPGYRIGIESISIRPCFGNTIMTEAPEYRFVIDALSPDTLPMSRLAVYMADLARLFGTVERVHFVRLEAGSTVLVPRVDPEAVAEVENRLVAVAENRAPEDATKAFKALNRYLADDRATGSLRDGGSAEVIRFPGRDQPKSLTFGAFTQPGVLDGVLIRVGDRDETVPVHLQDGDTIHVCNATRDMARQLAAHLYGRPLRVHGEGRWERDANGAWSMKRFNITEFDELDDAPLGAVVERLRGVEGSGWREIDDLSTELHRLRGHEETR